jgi:hypothetical protein
MECAPPSLVADAASSLSEGDRLLHMIHTRHGARAACAALAYGTPRDRKRAVRAFKGHVLASACDEWGHLPLLTALAVVDDTELLRKTLLSELQVRFCVLRVRQMGLWCVYGVQGKGSGRRHRTAAQGAAGRAAGRVCVCVCG